MSRMSELDLTRKESRCGLCGTRKRATTIVVDFRAELMCDDCIARCDWSDWNFDPVLNVYSHA